MEWRDVQVRRGVRNRTAEIDPPEVLPLLNVEDRDLLSAWVRKDNAGRSREALLKAAGASNIERADALCERLLREGWITRKERLHGGTWQWDSIAWRDLDRLKSLLGVGSRIQRAEARVQSFQQAHVWLENSQIEGHTELRETVAQAIQQLEEEYLLRVDVVSTRLDLIKSLVDWFFKQMNGTRRDFALFVGDHTKSISAGDWKWLEKCFDLEGLGVTRFQPMVWLAGDVQLFWGDRSVDLSPLHCLAFSLDDLLQTTAIHGKSECWWLIENRTSFERQARKRPMAALMAWVPGRPSQGWLRAIAHLLSLAPIDLKVSADADPAGIDIAKTVGNLWRRGGLGWEPYKMGMEEWGATTQKWPLNEHDKELLRRLLDDTDLPSPMKLLCAAMMQEGRKAEQEGWL